MTDLNIGKALAPFETAEYMDLDCGAFEIRIRPAAQHNEQFRAAVSKRALVAKKKSLVASKGSMTGSIDEDIELFLDHIIEGWGERPLLNDDGKPVKYTREVGQFLFKGTGRKGKVLFGKVLAAAVDDDLFMISEDDLGNS